jgi:hypothetical protein
VESTCADTPGSLGLIDVLAIKRDETLAVQCTSSGVAERIRKIQESEYLPKVREAGLA